MWVAPYVGAWIETSRVCASGAFEPSLPTWERGLKPYQILCLSVAPSQERGVKPIISVVLFSSASAVPYAKAVIETFNNF